MIDPSVCCCSEYQNSGIPCPPGTCPNVPRVREPAACAHLIRDGQTTIGSCQLERGHDGEHQRGEPVYPTYCGSCNKLSCICGELEDKADAVARLIELAEVAVEPARENVDDGDFPPFGVDPKDSASLEKLQMVQELRPDWLKKKSERDV